MYSQHNPAPPGGILPQGQRPQGYGRPSNLPPQGAPISPPPQQPPMQGYQQPAYQPHGYMGGMSNVSRLLSQIPLNQYINGIGANEITGEGFNAYSYQREQRQQKQQQQPQATHSFYGDQNNGGPNQQQPADQEIYLQNVKEYSARAANRIYEQLHNKLNRPYETVKAALQRFHQPQNGVPDGVIGEYVNEINGNIQLYRYCCSYACIILTALFTEQVLQGRAEDVEHNGDMLASMLTESFTTVVALQFLDWLEKHPRSLIMVNRLLPKTLANIEHLENRIEGIESTVLSVGDMRQSVSFPWRKGVLQRIRQTAEAGSATYDFYNMYNTGEPLQTNWGENRTMSQNYHTPSSSETEYEEPEWYTAYKKALFADEGERPNPHAQNSYYGQTERVMLLNPINDNWGHQDSTPPMQHVHSDPQPQRREHPVETQQMVEEQLELKAEQLVRETVHHANPLEWFVKLPDGTSDQYVVHPRYFKHIAKVLRYDGRETAYERLCIGDDYLPIVNLSWETRVYDYELLYVGANNMKFFLTNPQHVLPQLKETNENREKYIQVYNDYIEDLNAVLSPAAEEANKECRTLKKEPKVVHTNVPIVTETNEGCVQSVRQVAALVGKKYKKRPDAIIIPTETLKPLEVVDAPDFHYDQIEEHLSYLVTGYKPTTNLETYIMNVSIGIGKVGSPMLKFYIEEHLTDVFNRWLVERRFYSPTRDSGDYIKVGNIMEDYKELIEVLNERKDKESVALLNAMVDEEFFFDNLPMFANKKRQKKYIEDQTKAIEDPAMREATKISLDASVLLQRQFVIAHIDPMSPIEEQGRVVMEGSKYPELHWLLQNAPGFGRKHFGRKVPVVVMFNKDSYPRMWASTFSPFCTHKFTLRQVTLNKPLPLLKVM